MVITLPTTKPDAGATWACKATCSLRSRAGPPVRLLLLLLLLLLLSHCCTFVDDEADDDNNAARASNAGNTMERNKRIAAGKSENRDFLQKRET